MVVVDGSERAVIVIARLEYGGAHVDGDRRVEDVSAAGEGIGWTGQD